MSTIKMFSIHLLTCLLLLSVCFADEEKPSKRISRSLDLNPLHLLPFKLFGKKPDVITTVVEPLANHPIVVPNLPIWKIHKYNGIKLNPVPLSSLPYVQVPIAPPPDENTGLPSLSEIMSLLGTTTTVETLAAIKEIASTRDGLRLIANFVKKSLNKPHMTDDQIGSLISNYKFSQPSQEYSHIPSHNTAPAQYYASPVQKYGPPAQNYLLPPNKYGPPPPTSYGSPIKQISPPDTTYLQPPTSYRRPTPYSEQITQITSSVAHGNGIQTVHNQPTAGFSYSNQFTDIPAVDIENSKFIGESDITRVANTFDKSDQSGHNDMSFFNDNDIQKFVNVASSKTYELPIPQAEQEIGFASLHSDGDHLQKDQNQETAGFSSFNHFKPLRNVYGTPEAPANVNVVDNSKILVESDIMTVSDSFDNNKSDNNGVSSFIDHNQKPTFVAPAKTYGIPKQYTESISDSQNEGIQETAEHKKEIIEANSESVNDDSQIFILPSEKSKSTFKVEIPIKTYGPPINTYGIPMAPAKTDVIDSSSGVVIEADHMSEADAFNNNEQVFILPSEESKSTFKVDIPSNMYGTPSKTNEEVDFSANSDVHDSSSSFDEEIEQMSTGNSFDDNAQEFKPPSEENKIYFKVDTPTIVYGRPVKMYDASQDSTPFDAQSQIEESLTFTVPSQETQDTFNDANIDSVSAPVQVYGQPQAASPTQTTFANSQGGVNSESTNFDNFGSFNTPMQIPQTQYENPSSRNAVPFAQTYPGYEPTPVSGDIQKTVGGFSDTFLPFPILPKLPFLPDAENLASGQLGTNFFEKISPDNNKFVTSSHANYPSFSLTSGPPQTQNYQREGFIPTGDPHNKYLYSVQQSSLTTGITDPGVKVTNSVTQEDGRPVNSLNYEHPNFSYTQLSKLPLETGPRFYKYPGQISSYGEAVPSYVFEDDNVPQASEMREIVVARENKIKEAKIEATKAVSKLPIEVNQDNKNKMVVEQKSVVVSNNPRKHIFERRPWVSLSKRKIGQQNNTPPPPSPLTAGIKNKQPEKQTNGKQ